MPTDKDWVIESVKDISDSEFGKKFRIFLKDFEGEVSGFTKFPDNLKAGEMIFGHVEKKGPYNNFKWGKKASRLPSSTSGTSVAEVKNMLDLAIRPQLDRMEKELIIVSERMDMLVNGKDDPMPKF